jgi:asparagine synthase (glutamine-hydrolysing)
VSDSLALRRLVERAPFATGAHVHASLYEGIGLAAAWRGDPPALASNRGVHVVLDGRLSDRESLRAALSDAHNPPPPGASDPLLAVHAYEAWGPSFVERLIGEFALCLRDDARRLAVAARDRHGVKPLFHAAVPGGWAVASSIAALRTWPGVDTRLSDAAIGDFLLFGEMLEPEATCFEAISRVAPGGFVSSAASGCPRAGTYFRLGAVEPIRYRDPRDYVEHFRDLLDAAVRERVDGSPVSILMSGGLDSSSVAASAVRRGGAPPERCWAVTAVYDRLFDDEERRFSSATAKALGLSIEHVPVDDYDLFARWDTDAGPPEPSVEVLSAVMLDLLAVAGRHAGVVLTGDGGDPSLLPGAVVRHLGRVPISDLVRGLWRTLRLGLWPPLGLRSGLVRRARRGRPLPPSWLSARLRQRYDPMARWAEGHARAIPWPQPRGESLSLLASSTWAQTFETADPNSTGLPVEVRYPFFDARVIAFALSLPSYPWCVNKTVLREAAAGRLPDVIRLRPKAPLRGDPVALRAWPTEKLLTLVEATPVAGAFLDMEALSRAGREGGLLTDRRPGTMAAAALAMWLNTPAGRTATV